MQRLLLIGTRNWSDMHTPLLHAGYDVSVTSPDHDELRDLLGAFTPDALVFELGDDIFLLQHLRRILRAEMNDHPVPVLALARRSHLQPAQFVAGVDDFILMPYAVDELLARIQMLLWRFHQINATNRVRSGGLILDLAQRTVSVDLQAVSLTLREYQLLQFLMTHRTYTFARETLLVHVWGYNFDGDVRVVDAYVKRVRSKLPERYASCIQTIRGVGYRFSDPQEDTLDTRTVLRSVKVS